MATINTKATTHLRGGVIEGKDFSARMREGMDRNESIRVLKELQTQLRKEDGSAKGGILRLMNASNSRGNVDKTMHFERKNALQGARYFSGEGRERTAQALRILFQNAGLSTRGLDEYLSNNKNKAGGDEFLALLNQEMIKVDEVTKKGVDVDSITHKARQLTSDMGLLTKRADIAELIPRFRTLETELQQYLDEVDPPVEGAQRLAEQTPPVQKARQEIEVAREALAALGDIRDEAADRVGGALRLMNEANVKLDELSARFEAHEPAAAIHTELSRLRSEIRARVREAGAQAAVMEDDKQALGRASDEVLAGLDALLKRIEAEYTTYKTNPAAEWQRFSEAVRQEVGNRLSALGQDVNSLLAQQRELLVRMADLGRTDTEKESDLQAWHGVKGQLQQVCDEAKAQRAKLTALRQQWQSADRWKEMPFSIRASASAQVDIDAKVRALLARDKTYVSGAAKYFSTEGISEPDPARLNELRVMLSDPERLQEAAVMAREQLHALGGAAAAGAAAAHYLDHNPQRVAAWVAALVDAEGVDEWDSLAHALLQGAFPAAVGAAFGESSAQFHAAMRELIRIQPEVGLAAAEIHADIYGGLVAPHPNQTIVGPVERKVLRIHDPGNVQLRGLQARDAVIRLAAGRDYDLAQTAFERSVVIFQIDPRLHLNGFVVRNFDASRWTDTSLSFEFAEFKGNASQWVAALGSAGQLVLDLPNTRGDQARLLVRQLMDFSGSRHARSIATTVVSAIAKFPEVANDATVTEWVEDQGGPDELMDQSWDHQARERYELAVQRSRLSKDDLSQVDVMEILLAHREFLLDSDVVGWILKRPDGVSTLAQTMFLCPEETRAGFVGRLDRGLLPEQAAPLRELLTVADQCPILEPGAIGAEATPQRVIGFLDLLDRVAREFPSALAERRTIAMLPNLLAWRDQLEAGHVLRDRIDAIEQAVLHSPRLNENVRLPGLVDFLPELETMSYGSESNGKWTWTEPHYLIPTGKRSDDGFLYLLIRADAYRDMGVTPSSVDWGLVHLLAAKETAGQEEDAAPKFEIRQLGAQARAEAINGVAPAVPLMSRALLSGDSEFISKLFKHLELPESLRTLLSRGVKGVGVDAYHAGANAALGVAVDTEMGEIVQKWVTDQGSLADDHLTALRTWAIEQGIASNDRQFAMFLFNLSAAITRLSSAGALGTGDASVGSMRQYGHLLFKQCRDEIEKVLTERPGLVSGKTPKAYLDQTDLLFSSDECSSLLSTPMMDIGANMDLASYLRTAPRRFMSPNRSDALQLLLAGDEGERRAADDFQVLQGDNLPVFRPDDETIQAQDDINDQQGKNAPSLTRIFESFNLASRIVAQGSDDYAGFVIASRRGLASYQEYVNSLGFAPSWQFAHLPTLAQRQDAALQAGLTIGVGELEAEKRLEQGPDGTATGYRHTPHSWLVDQATMASARLEMADAEVVHQGLLAWEAIAEATADYDRAAKEIKLAQVTLPTLDNWPGPLPSRLEEVREQRSEMLWGKVGQQLEQMRGLLPSLIDATGRIELMRAEIDRRDQMMVSQITARQAKLESFPNLEDPRRITPQREISLLNQHRESLAKLRAQLSIDGLVRFESRLREDLDLFRQLGLLPEPEPALEPEAV